MPSESMDKASDEQDNIVVAAIDDYAHNEHACLNFDDEYLMKYPNWWSKYR